MARGEMLGKLPPKLVEHYEYTPEVFVPFLRSLVEASNQSFRQVSFGAGLDHGAVRRYLKAGTKPSQDACIALAGYFNVHPNEMLLKAGYPPRAYFDLSLADPDEFPPDVKQVAQELMKIEGDELRRRVSESVLQLLQQMFTQIESDQADPSEKSA